MAKVKIIARKVDLDFFRNLSVGRTADDEDSAGSILPSFASRASMRENPGPLGPSPGNKTITEEMATI